MGLDQRSANSVGRIIQANKDGLYLTVDELTRTLSAVNYEHHEIHEGNHFYFCKFQQSLAVGGRVIIGITTPETDRQAHMTFKFTSSLGALLTVKKDPDTFSGGTVITPINNNHNVINPSVLSIKKDPVYTGGSEVGAYFIAAGRAAGSLSRENEKVFQTNSTYIFDVESTANPNTIGWCFEWYEHTPKNL